MHPQDKPEEQKMNFLDFIKENFMWYDVDHSNKKIIEDLGLWCNRDESFNGKELGWHIDKSLFIYGNPGVGKDEIFRMVNKYLSYLKSRYIFDHKIVWEFGNEFSNKETGGYRVFGAEGKQNRYYEELALTDEMTGFPNREIVNHFGNKVLIGAELIHVTHNGFKNQGYMAHFSSNVREGKLAEIYGERAYSRLKYMCNFMQYIGPDRRRELTPMIINNRNKPKGPPTPAAASSEIERENKEIIDNSFIYYCETGNLPPDAQFFYDSITSWGIRICSDEDLLNSMVAIGKQFTGAAFYRDKSEKIAAKKEFAWKQARILAVESYYKNLKAQGALSIFGEKSFNVDSIAKDIVEKKEQTDN